MDQASESGNKNPRTWRRWIHSSTSIDSGAAVKGNVDVTGARTGKWGGIQMVCQPALRV